jgi:hypothetical protein
MRYEQHDVISHLQLASTSSQSLQISATFSPGPSILPQCPAGAGGLGGAEGGTTEWLCPEIRVMSRIAGQTMELLGSAGVRLAPVHPVHPQAAQW